jgi:hypothetical protein
MSRPAESPTPEEISPVFRLSDKTTLFPVIHESGDFSVAIRRFLLHHSFDCLAVPLPPSFAEAVEQAILQLPSVSIVLQRETAIPTVASWTPPAETRDDDEQPEFFTRAASYVPVEPCQPVIAALRAAMEERIPRVFIDLETDHFECHTAVYPDPYSLKHTTPEAFAAAILPAIPPPPGEQAYARIQTMAHRLHELEQRYNSILCLCSLTDWPWIRKAYQDRLPPVTDDQVEPVETFAVTPETLHFMMGELPYITGLYERARAELESDENLSIDGVKTMLLATRDEYREDLGSRARKITPKLLKTYFQYVRNLTLIQKHLTPSLYTLISAAQQIAGDLFAVQLADVAQQYGYPPLDSVPPLRMGINKAALPDGTFYGMKTRLPGQTRLWCTLKLTPKPPQLQQQDWQSRWNPFRQCSWPPEDLAIEKFRTHIKDSAIALMGADLARSEKFTTSLKDGLDMRETLRNWHSGELYVRINPPARGNLDCVIMLFDSPADPRTYPWRVTWHAEHHDESTLSLFATDYRASMQGPGIGMATYGGAMFLFPPRPIPDIWRSRHFDHADTLEERLIMAACHYSREKHIAMLSPLPPGLAWKKIAQRYGKKLIHLPLSRFSQETIEKLRVFHVLNGTSVRSYAAHFIRKG